MSANSFHDDVQVRLSRPRDVSVLTGLDLKCYHYPMDFEEWKDFLNRMTETSQVVILEIGRTAVGFAAWEVNYDREDIVINILRLGVLPGQRRRGYGRILVESIVKGAKRMKAKAVVTLAPEIHCCPGDPDDVSAFLNACGFEPTGDISRDYKVMYGREVDGYLFIRRL